MFDVLDSHARFILSQLTGGMICWCDNERRAT